MSNLIELSLGSASGRISVLVGVFSGLTAADLRLAVLYVLFLVAAISVHEFAHAFAAHRLGDPTPRSQGRLTLNPIAHADPVGTLVLPFVAALNPGWPLLGWGRPVEFQPRLLTRKISMRAGAAIVAFAGPLSNVLLAVLTLGTVWALGLAGVVDGRLGIPAPVRDFFTLNVVLAVFNLLPVHPLDGGDVLRWLMGSRGSEVDAFLSRWGWVILLGLLLTGVLGDVLRPFTYWANTLLDAVV